MPLWMDTEVFFEAARIEADDRSTRTMELRRAEAGLGHQSEPTILEFRLEATRAAAPESLLGLDGNSLVVRVKRAYGARRFELGPVELEARAGLAPDRFTARMDATLDLRATGPLLAERGGFLETSELGAGARVAAFEGRIAAAFDVLQGEGRRELETNDVWDVAGLVEVEPVEGVFVLGHGRRGRLGPGEARNDRFGVGLAWRGERHAAGLEYQRAEGVEGRGAQTAEGLGLALQGRVWVDGPGGVVRFERLDVDFDRDDSIAHRWTAGVFTDLGPDEATRFRVWGLWQDERLGVGARPIPGDPGVVQRVLGVVELLAGGGL
jgi:hypothetical protein